jgi:hypothetical protein
MSLQGRLSLMPCSDDGEAYCTCWLGSRLEACSPVPQPLQSTCRWFWNTCCGRCCWQWCDRAQWYLLAPAGGTVQQPCARIAACPNTAGQARNCSSAWPTRALLLLPLFSLETVGMGSSVATFGLVTKHGGCWPPAFCAPWCMPWPFHHQGTRPDAAAAFSLLGWGFIGVSLGVWWAGNLSLSWVTHFEALGVWTRVSWQLTKCPGFPPWPWPCKRPCSFLLLSFGM